MTALRIKAFTMLIVATLTAGVTQAQIAPTDMVGDPAQWSYWGDKNHVGLDEGFSCHVTDFRDTDNIDYDGRHFTHRVKLDNGSGITLPQMTDVGRLTIYVMGGAGADRHANGTQRSYVCYLDVEQQGKWQTQWTSFGASMTKANQISRYDITVNSRETVRLRLRNADAGSVWLCGLVATAASDALDEPWQSALLSQDADGHLTYHEDADGFRLNDWSQCGYRNGREPVPDVVVGDDRTVVVEPLADADNTQRINNAIAQVARLTPRADGIRGVVLLKAGYYVLDGQINLQTDGVILRGEGNAFNEPDPDRQTRLYRRGAADQALQVVLMGKSGSNWWAEAANKGGGVRGFVTTERVMPGDWSLELDDASRFQVGDAVYIKYPYTQSLLDALDKGGNTNADAPWTLDTDINICYYRYIERIEGNRIYFDAPLYYAMDRSLARPWVARMNTSGYIVRHVGLENMDIAVERSPSSSTSKAQQHCVSMSSCEDSWIRDVSTTGFIHAGFHLQATTRSTLERCYAVDPSGLNDGGNYYNFDIYQMTQLVLLDNCYGRRGRHHVVSNGCASVSGIAVHNFVSEEAINCSEGHRYLSQGILFDGWNQIDKSPWAGLGMIGFYLRNNMGTAHGWGAVQSVMWNCDVKDGDVLCERIPTGQNYAIGCQARSIHRYLTDNSNYTNGYIEGHNRKRLAPASLWEAQVRDYRLRQTEGIALVPAANTGTAAVYSLQGTKVADAFEPSRLPAGLYVTGGRKVAVRH